MKQICEVTTKAYMQLQNLKDSDKNETANN